MTVNAAQKCQGKVLQFGVVICPSMKISNLKYTWICLIEYLLPFLEWEKDGGDFVVGF